MGHIPAWVIGALMLGVFFELDGASLAIAIIGAALFGAFTG